MFFWMHFKWFWIKAWAHSVKLKENSDFWQTVLIEVSPKYLMWVMHTKKVHTHPLLHPSCSVMDEAGGHVIHSPDMGQWPGVKAATFPSWTEHQPAGNMFLLQQCLVRITITSPRFFCTRRYRGHQQVSSTIFLQHWSTCLEDLKAGLCSANCVWFEIREKLVFWGVMRVVCCP